MKVIHAKLTKKKDKIHSFFNSFSLVLKALVSAIAIFVGFFVWLDGYKVFFDVAYEPVYINYLLFFYWGFWLITLCFLFKDFLSINLLSKILVFFFALGISIEFWVLM